MNTPRFYPYMRYVGNGLFIPYAEEDEEGVYVRFHDVYPYGLKEEQQPPRFSPGLKHMPNGGILPLMEPDPEGDFILIPSLRSLTT